LLVLSLALQLLVLPMLWLVVWMLLVMTVLRRRREEVVVKTSGQSPRGVFVGAERIRDVLHPDARLVHGEEISD